MSGSINSQIASSGYTLYVYKQASILVCTFSTKDSFPEVYLYSEKNSRMQTWHLAISKGSARTCFTTHQMGEE